MVTSQKCDFPTWQVYLWQVFHKATGAFFPFWLHTPQIRDSEQNPNGRYGKIQIPAKQISEFVHHIYINMIYKPNKNKASQTSFSDVNISKRCPLRLPWTWTRTRRVPSPVVLSQRRWVGTGVGLKLLCVLLVLESYEFILLCSLFFWVKPKAQNISSLVCAEVTAVFGSFSSGGPWAGVQATVEETGPWSPGAL